MKRLMLAALALAPAAFAQETPPPAVDQSALQPVLSHAWSADGSCTGDVVDWVVDKDGWPYSRAMGFTPLVKLEFRDGMLTTADEVGIGRTDSVYRLGSDGTLRLWSESSTDGDPADGGGKLTQRVKDGHIVIDDAGKPASPGEETPAMKPCAPRTAMIAADATAALNGTWGIKTDKGICPADGQGVTFDLDRPIPHSTRKGEGGESMGDAWVLSIEKQGEAWKVTEGSSFDAAIYLFTPGADSTLTQSTEYDDNKLVLARCP